MDYLAEARANGDTMVAHARKQFHEKAAAPQTVTNGGYLNSSQDSERSRRNYNLNTGWTFASIRPIAVRCAKQPFRVGKKKRGKGKNFTKERMTFAQTKGLPDFIKGQLSEETTFEMQESHPFLSAMADPNDLMTEWCLKYITAASMQLAGKAYWWMIPSKRKKGQIDIWPIPAHWVTPDNSKKFRSGWIITPPGEAAGTLVDSNNVAFFYYPDPMDPFASRGPMDAARPAAETSEEIRTAQRSTFDHIAMPATAFITGMVPGDDGKMARPELTNSQKEQIELSLRQLYRGTSKWGRMIVLDRVIEDVKYLNQKPIEMDFPKSGQMTKEEIMQIFGVNEIVAGSVQDANRAAATVATEGFLD
ncbi:MAG: phage portal protein, partial [Bacteroidota bacterium]